MARAKGIETANARMTQRALFAAIACVGLALPPMSAQDARGKANPGQQLFSSNCSGCHGLDGRGGEHGPNIATRAEVQRLEDRDIFHIVRDGIAGAGMPAFRSLLTNEELNVLVSYVRVLQGKHSGVEIKGNPERGQALFFGKARCSECHTVAGQGGFIASDLSGYGKQHSPDVIRSAILDPNKNLDPRHGTVIAVTRDGQKYTGVVRNEDNFSLQLQTLDGKFHFFEKAELARVEHEPRSIMPSNYASTLSGSELDDLVSFLFAAPGAQTSSGGDEEEP